MVYLSDMSMVWADTLKGLKETNMVAYSAVADIKNVEFTHDSVNLYVNDQATYNLARKYLPEYVKVIFNKVSAKNSEKIEYLKSVLGDKLIIKES